MLGERDVPVLLVGLVPRGHEDHFVEVEDAEHLGGGNEMSVMDRVESPAHDSDPAPTPLAPRDEHRNLELGHIPPLYLARRPAPRGRANGPPHDLDMLPHSCSLRVFGLVYDAAAPFENNPGGREYSPKSRRCP